MTRSAVFLMLLLAACMRTATSPGRAPTPDAGAVARAPAGFDVEVHDESSDTAIAAEQRLALPLERALLGLPGARGIESRSVAGAARVHVTLAPGTSVFAARAAALERLAQADLPPGATPVLASLAAPTADDVRVVAASDRLLLTDLRDLLDWLVRPRLLTIPGVADVDVCGGRRREIQVEIDPARLAGTGLTLGGVASALTAGGRAAGGRGTGAFVVRGLGDYRDLDELQKLVVGSANGVPIRLGDVARVSAGAAPADCIALFDDAEVVAGRVLAQAGDEVPSVAATLAAITPALPPGVTLTRLGRAPGASVVHLAARLPATLALEARVRGARALSTRLRTHAEVERVLVEVFASEALGDDELALHVYLRANAPAGVSDVLGGELARLPDVAPSPANDGATLALIGPELSRLAELAAAARQALATTPGCSAIAVAGADTAPRLVVEVDRAALARNGVDTGELALTLAAARGGAEVAALADGGRRIPIRLRLGGGAATDPTWLATLPVATAKGTVPLAQLVRFESALVPRVVLRRDGQRQVAVQALCPREAMRHAAAGLALPVGYMATWDDAR